MVRCVERECINVRMVICIKEDLKITNSMVLELRLIKKEFMKECLRMGLNMDEVYTSQTINRILLKSMESLKKEN